MKPSLSAPFVAALALSLGTVPSVMAQDLSCIVMTEGDPATRPSPLDSVSFTVDGNPVKVCYGRPSSRGRTMIGGSRVPYGEIWRTGANEPAMIHTSVALDIAGIAVPAGSYSLYTVPGEREWQIVVNPSIDQWGHEGSYTGDVAAQEIARAPVPSASLQEHVETFTIRAEGEGSEIQLVLEWEHTRVMIPVKKG